MYRALNFAVYSHQQNKLWNNCNWIVFLRNLVVSSMHRVESDIKWTGVDFTNWLPNWLGDFQRFLSECRLSMQKNIKIMPKWISISDKFILFDGCPTPKLGKQLASSHVM